MASSTCISHSPLYITRFPSSSPSSSSSSCCSSQSVSLYFRKAEAKKSSRALMASLRQNGLEENDSCDRRSILFLGVSFLPFLQLKALALTSSAPERTELKTPAENEELELQRESTPNPLSLLNGIGVFSSGVLGALYALARKEKSDSIATMESIETKLREKEAAIFSLEKSFESKLSKEQEERANQLRKAKEGQLALVDQLNSANSTISGLGNELKNEKRLIKELKFQIGSLQADLSKAGEDKKTLEEKLNEKIKLTEQLQDRVTLLSLELKDKEDNLQNLKSSLAGKELELKNLISSQREANDKLVVAHSEIQGLKDELLNNRRELEKKNSLVDELNIRIGSLTAERDDSKRKFDDLSLEYNSQKLSSEKKSALDAKLLGERENEIQTLKEKLETGVNEAAINQAIMVDLTRGKEDLTKKLEKESSNVNVLKHELETSQEALSESRKEVSDLVKQLKQSKDKCTELEDEISRLQNEYLNVTTSLQRSIEESKLSGEVLSSELTEVKKLLEKTKEELQTTSQELSAMVENRDDLQKELVDVYKRAETATNDLKEEKKIISSLNKELQALEKLILEDQESRKLLETDLEEATKSLDEMNRNASTLSRDLEKANSWISNLEDEKQVLYKSLTEQKNAAKEARENMEDAHNLVMRLGKERESLEKKGKKLEEELASTKGEILRLRSQINSSKVVVNNQPKQKAEDEDNDPVTGKKTVRRRKTGSQ